MKNLFYILCLLTICLRGFGQQKTEKQHRIRPSEVPAPARKLMDEHFNSSNIKWYREETDGDISIEAKASRQGKRYSLDFNRSGEIRDVEILTSLSSLPADLQNKIRAYLERNFIRYKILKVQEHWKTSPESVNQILNQESRTKTANVQYEVELRGRGRQGILIYKIIFDQNGSVVE